MSLEQILSKISSKLDVARELTEYVYMISDHNFVEAMQQIYADYQEYVLPEASISVNAASVGTGAAQGVSPAAATNSFKSAILAHNIIGRTDKIISDIRAISKSIPARPQIEFGNVYIKDNLFLILDTVGTINRYIDIYGDRKVNTTIDRIKPYVCCNVDMVRSDVEAICPKCGAVEILVGTSYEEVNGYNAQLIIPKSKPHDSNKHCYKWLCFIQAKAVKSIPAEALEQIDKKAVREYTRNGQLRSMDTMTCREVRTWLKALGLTKYNNLAPMIRKVITHRHGRAVAPPELTREEERLILNDFEKAMSIYDKKSKQNSALRKLEKDKIKNKMYYPYCLMKILMHRLRGDSRLTGILQCIHIQSTETLQRDDRMWKIICTSLPGYIYAPTDRTMFL